MSEQRGNYNFRSRIEARITRESCESCGQRAWEYIVHDTFVCGPCNLGDAA
jgi:hypothetical protein